MGWDTSVVMHIGAKDYVLVLRVSCVSRHIMLVMLIDGHCVSKTVLSVKV